MLLSFESVVQTVLNTCMYGVWSLILTLTMNQSNLGVRLKN